MTSRERISAEINHKEPDKIPLDLGSSLYSTMHVSVAAELRKYFGLDGLVKLGIPFGMQPVVEEDLSNALGSDTFGVLEYENVFGFLNGMVNNDWRKWATPQGLEILVPQDFEVESDGQGGWYLYPQNDHTVKPSGHIPANGFYFDQVERGEHFDEDDLHVEDNLEEYVAVQQPELDYFAREAKKARSTGKAVYCNFGRFTIGNHAYIPGPSLKHPKGVRSVQDWFYITAADPDFCEEVLQKATDITIENLKKYHEAVGDNIDVIMLDGADWGTQRAPLYSKKTIQELYFPFEKRLNDWIHSNTTWKTFKHTCGSVANLIPSIIDAGFDILNPIQVSAAGMDRQKLKDEYGKYITFWGGGLDTQHTLPFGTPEQIREEVLKSCEVFGKGGGFVFTQVHSIQANTPIKNVLAMINALREFNGDTPL
jgi:hypothetical protein